MKNVFSSFKGKVLSSHISEEENMNESKSTNINILLNRVRLEKKKTFNKRIFISLCLTTVVSLLAVFVIIQS